MRGFENYRPDKKSLLQIIRILFIVFLTNALRKMAIVYCTVYTQLRTQLRTHVTIFSAPIS
jgi:hypothetical protein